MYVDESSDPAGRRLDLPGQMTAIICLGLFAFTAIEGQTAGWGSTLIRSTLIGAARYATACWRGTVGTV
jgi:hypothetical protein